MLKKQKRILIGGIVITLAGLLAACQPLDHFILHPSVPPASVKTWHEERTKGDLVLRLEWARPEGAGLFPAVLVYPEAGKTAADMRGVIIDLATHGYLAMSADYQRLIDGRQQTSMFPWKNEEEARTAYEILKASEEVDKDRIGALGFSQGGVYSLLFAAQFGSGLKAVVAYYPITDFAHLLDPERAMNFIERIIVNQIRDDFRKQAGPVSDEEFAALLRKASPIDQAGSITAPVLFIHGSADTTAPVEESQRMYARLKELGKKTELLVIPGAVHVFNFRNRDQAALAWAATLRWLDENLK